MPKKKLGPPSALSPQQEERIRSLIDGTKLVNRLQTFVHASITFNEMGVAQVRDEHGTPIRGMTKEQLVAAKLLLDRVLPPLPTAETKPEETRVFVLRAPPEARDAMEWLERYGPKTIDHKEKGE